MITAGVICVGCGCDDDHACPPTCSWLRVDSDNEIGVCSSCSHLVEGWDRGEREISDAAMDAAIARSYAGAEECAAEDPGLILPGDTEFAETFRMLRSR